METKIGMPSTAGMMDAAKSGLYGAAAGFVYQFVSGYFGSNVIGSLVAIAVTGSLIKGETGKMLAAVLGFNLVMSGNFNIGGLGGNKEESGEAAVGVI